MGSKKKNNPKKEAISPDLLFKQEMKSLEFLTLAYLGFFFCANLGLWIADMLGVSAMPGVQTSLSIISIISCLSFILSAVFFKKKIAMAKFVIFPIAAILIFVGTLWVGNIWMFFAFFPVISMIGLFNDWRLSFVMGALAVFTFVLLAIITRFFAPSSFIMWFTYLSLSSVIVVFITMRNYNFLVDFSKMMQSTEETNAVLEIKVRARTKELEEMTQDLEKKIQERTKELETKINEMEKFQKFTIGRELKMMELKKQIKELQK